MPCPPVRLNVHRVGPVQIVQCAPRLFDLFLLRTAPIAALRAELHRAGLAGAPAGESQQRRQQPGRGDAAAQTPLSSRLCRVVGHVLAGDMPLPGVSIRGRSGDKVVAITSTDVDGSYAVPLAPGTRAHLELMAFAVVDREVTGRRAVRARRRVEPATSLASRTRRADGAGIRAASGGGFRNGANAGCIRECERAAERECCAGGPARRNAAADADSFLGGGQGRGGRGGPPRFQTLTVQQSEGAATEAVLDVTLAARADDPAARPLPPGFLPTRRRVRGGERTIGRSRSRADAGSTAALGRGSSASRRTALLAQAIGGGAGDGQIGAQGPVDVVARAVVLVAVGLAGSATGDAARIVCR